MAVPLNHLFIDGFSVVKHVFWGTPIYGNPHIHLWQQNHVLHKPQIFGNAMSLAGMVAAYKPSNLGSMAYIEFNMQKTAYCTMMFWFDHD